MEHKTEFTEPLFAKAEEFGKTSFELCKLKALDKTTGVVSSMVSNGVAVLVLSMFTVIANIGVALWLGDLLGKVYFGFFCVAGFYGIAWVVLRFFLQSWIKKSVGNTFILNMLN